MKYTNFHKISPNARKVRACFLRSHVCDIIQFRVDYARMRIRDPLVPVESLKFQQQGKSF